MNTKIRVLAALVAAGPSTVKEISETIGESTPRVRVALRDLYKSGRVLRTRRVSKTGSWCWVYRPVDASSFSLLVIGEPLPKQSFRIGPRPYEEQKVIDWEQHVRHIAYNLVSKRQRPLFPDQPLGVRLIFRRSTHRCDVGALIKPVLDALNGLIWNDDSQIVEQRASLIIGSKPFAYMYVAILNPRWHDSLIATSYRVLHGGEAPADFDES